MERDGFDVIVAPPASGPWDYWTSGVRYLTGIGGNGSEAAAVFPLEGDVTALVAPVPPKRYWLGFQDWISDIRECPRLYGDAIVQRLKELRVRTGTIGIVGVGGVARQPEGFVPYGIYTKIRDAFPRAKLRDATSLLDEARFVKSAEELVFLEIGTALVERAIEVMVEEARPGVPENILYSRMITAMLEQGGELPTMLLWSVGWPQAPRGYTLPTQRRLQKGDVINAQIEANYCGYRAQVAVQAVLGRIPPGYDEMFTIQQVAVARCYHRLRPGARMGDFVRLCQETGEGTPFKCDLVMDGRGLGDDSPRIVRTTEDEHILSWRVAKNSVYVIKPRVWMAPMGGRPGRFVSWGDTVVATPNGAKRLGRRKAEIIQIGM
jgi:Xaa-Pro aminopeptidase